MSLGSRFEFADPLVSPSAVALPEPRHDERPAAAAPHVTDLPHPEFLSARRLYAFKMLAVGVYTLLALGSAIWLSAADVSPRSAVTLWLTVSAVAALAGVAVWKMLRRLPLMKRGLTEKVLLVGTAADILAFDSALPARLPFHSAGVYLTDGDASLTKSRLNVLGSLPSTYLLAPDEADRILLVTRSLTSQHQTVMLEKLEAFSCPVNVCLLPLTTNHINTAGTLAGCTLAPARSATGTPAGLFWKRAFDIAASSAALLLLLPLLLVIAVLVRTTSQGPVFFRQPRWGRDGRIFNIYKFRSMYVDQCDNGHGKIRQARKDDDRITPIGRFIRSTSIDELPQLLNVLRGEMSLIGPRPHAVGHNLEYTPTVEGYLARHRVKPGLSGWAQVHGHRGETPTVEAMQARIDCDNEYIRRWSLVMDILIVFKTINLVISRKNAW